MSETVKELTNNEGGLSFVYEIKEEVPMEDKLYSYDDVINKYQELFEATTTSLSVTSFAEIENYMNEIGRIRRLTVTNKKLATIPDEVGLLSGLRSIDLSSNKILYINPLIFDLASLKCLCLQHNELTKIPKEIGKLIHLEELYLNNNNLSQFPPIQGLHKLSILDLSHNFLTSITLEKNQNNIIEDNANGFENFTELEEVYLSHNLIHEIPEEFVSSLHNLLVFDASYNELTKIPTSFANLYQLKELHFANNAITDIPIAYHDLENLVVFDVAKNPTSLPPQMICLQGAQAIRTYLEQYSSHKGLDSEKLSSSRKNFFRQDAFRIAEGKSTGSLNDFSGFLESIQETHKKRAMTKSFSDTNDRPFVPKIKAKIAISLKMKKARTLDLEFTEKDEQFVYEYFESDKEQKVFLVQQEENTACYNNHFANQSHSNYIGLDESQSPIILSVKKTPNEDKFFEVLIWTTQKTQMVRIKEDSIDSKSKILSNGSSRSLLKYLRESTPILENIELSVVNHPIFSQLLVNLERRLMINGYKFGVLNLKNGQKLENECYSNVEISPEFDEFLQSIGEKVELSSLLGSYSAGLDTKHNSTGTHTITAKIDVYPLVFHVSSYLPYSSENPQQLERKRHIGNDIIVIIFVENDTKFVPSMIISEFNHVFVVVSPIMIDDLRHYRVEIVCKKGVPVGVPPHLPNPPIFKNGPEFKNWFLTKLINLERMAYQSPMFDNKLRRTRKALLLDVIEEVKSAMQKHHRALKFPFINF